METPSVFMEKVLGERTHPEMRCQDGKAKVSPKGIYEIYEAKVGVVPPKLL